MATAFLPGSLLPLHSIQLGRFILNVKNPHQDFFDPFGLLQDSPEFLQSSEDNFHETRRFSKTTKLRPYLSALSISFKSQNTGVSTLTAPKATTHDLKDPQGWFAKACGKAETRRFLENENSNGGKVYMVVGFRTVHDSSMVRSTVSSKFHGVIGEIPIAVVGPGDMAIGATITRDFKRGHEAAFKGPGEQVFAIIYHEVKFKWLSRPTADNMTLKVNPRWTTCWEWRGVEDDDGEEYDDVLEAYLTDCSDLDILDDESPSEDNIKEDGAGCKSVGSCIVSGCIERELEGNVEWGRSPAPLVLPSLSAPSFANLNGYSENICESPETFIKPGHFLVPSYY
ncbi:hypothetical protein Q9L58_009982 [Maublancomyces gigas]|uniref:Uncharacterized protein n=1 Tax=Discina gigas TaxID=1032678 RepID=A0ABR3G5L3_9PEZI